MEYFFSYIYLFALFILETKIGFNSLDSSIKSTSKTGFILRHSISLFYYDSDCFSSLIPCLKEALSWINTCFVLDWSFIGLPRSCDYRWGWRGNELWAMRGWESSVKLLQSNNAKRGFCQVKFFVIFLWISLIRYYSRWVHKKNSLMYQWNLGHKMWDAVK
jgi:hypothetical protein